MFFQGRMEQFLCRGRPWFLKIFGGGDSLSVLRPGRLGKSLAPRRSGKH
jgi:hypothetical protein